MKETMVIDNGNVIIDTHVGGQDQTEVTLVTIVNGTHSWPGGSKEENRTTEISATDMMWDFFVAHPKQK